jgi:release factor glutamine methyltransferase
VFDVIVSNPPYIPTDVIEGLSPEVKEFEPMLALDGMKDGLEFYRRLAIESKKYLKKGGYLFMEIGCEQAESVMHLLEVNGYTQLCVIKDLANLDRVVKARWR